LWQTAFALDESSRACTLPLSLVPTAMHYTQRHFLFPYPPYFSRSLYRPPSVGQPSMPGVAQRAKTGPLGCPGTSACASAPYIVESIYSSCTGVPQGMSRPDFRLTPFRVISCCFHFTCVEPAGDIPAAQSTEPPARSLPSIALL